MGGNAFLKDAVRQLTSRRWIVPAILFFLFLGGTNVALALGRPAVGARAGAVFIGAVPVRLFAVIWISVAALRLAADSARKPWRIDAAFWLYLPLGLLDLFVAPFARLAARLLHGLAAIVLREAVTILAILPLAPWSVAVAVDRPTACSPRPWLRQFGRWLPPLALWAMLLLVPLSVLQITLSSWLTPTAGHPIFWLVTIADGMVDTLLAMTELALHVAAYRRIAKVESVGREPSFTIGAKPERKTGRDDPVRRIVCSVDGSAAR